MLILNGSPNKKGHSMTLAGEIFDVENANVLHLYDMEIASCDDCKACQHNIGCKFGDDWVKIYEALQNEDTLVLVSPIYFGALTDTLLRALNRFQQVFAAKFTHKIKTPNVKNLYLVATCGADNSVMFEGVDITMTILKQLLNAENMHAFTLTNTDAAVAVADETIAQFRKTVKKNAED